MIPGIPASSLSKMNPNCWSKISDDVPENTLDSFVKMLGYLQARLLV